MTVSIIIADDYPALRRGVRSWLEEHSDIEVVAEAKNGQESIQLVSELEPDLLVTDVHMPGLNGFEVLQSLRQTPTKTRGIIWAPVAEEEYLLEALRQGALGFVLKTSPAEVVLRAIRLAAQGAYFLDEPFSKRAVEVYLKKAQADRSDPLDGLTPREREVLHMVAEGSSSAEIARHLHISPRTVEQHRAHMMRKLQFRNQSELIRFALRRGIISTEE